jgi:hypothetical protein
LFFQTKNNQSLSNNALSMTTLPYAIEHSYVTLGNSTDSGEATKGLNRGLATSARLNRGLATSARLNRGLATSARLKTKKDPLKTKRFVVSVSLFAREATDFGLPKAVVHLWPSRHPSYAQDRALKSLGDVLPFSSTFLPAHPGVSTMSPFMVLRELAAVMTSLCSHYPSTGSPRILVLPMDGETFKALTSVTSLLLSSIDLDTLTNTMILAHVQDKDGGSSWSCLRNTYLDRSGPLDHPWTDQKSLQVSFEAWLDFVGIDPAYYVPVSRFGRDLVLEAPEHAQVSNLSIRVSNVASFSQHSYLTILPEGTQPTLLPSLSPSDEGVTPPRRCLYHNGPDGKIGSKDHVMITWTCSSLEGIFLSLDGRVLCTSEDFVEQNPFSVLEAGLFSIDPESTSITAHAAYFFTLAIWRHGSRHFKELVDMQLESSRFSTSRTVTALSTELLRFSSKHQHNPAVAKVIEELVTVARARLDAKESPLGVIPEEPSEDAPDAEFIVSFLEMADKWYEHHVMADGSTDPAMHRWASFWADTFSILQSVRSMATASPGFPPRSAPLERQFSCIAPPALTRRPHL